ncbi:nuclear transport factor 2 family protein [Micromonospora sp. NPDC050495]|uniref:nuclear transport factor 2 family protein n=1 Tax=Micromonospora sp. NPDC050495 TaxID=3154936 RepID=UPI0033FDF6A7
MIIGRWELDLLYHQLFRAELGGTDFQRVPSGGPTACVWELLAINHERQAWVEHVLRRPADPDVAAYLAATVQIPAPAPSTATHVPPGTRPVGAREGKMTPDRLRAFGDARARGDVALMSFMTDDCEYSASVGPEPGRTYRGRDEVRQGSIDLLAYDAGGESRDGVRDERGTAQWSYVFRQPDGGSREGLGCDLFRFRGDKIVKRDAYRKALG